MLAANTILQNRYRVVRKLGQGGMGAIYEAIDQRVSCIVALKETLVGSSNEARAAFHREAELLANLRHPALPKVMDYFGEGDGEFLVMEFIPGHDLAELLSLRDGPFPQLQVVHWAIELLRLLEYLHNHEPSILHRDIKPSNLKATTEGEIFLLDFGLAKGATGQMLTVATTNSVPGYTPVYAPIEQILGQGTDPRSDLYSLGATLYHLLTGQTPVSAPIRFDAFENNRADPLRAANQINIEIAAEVSDCIQDAMSLSRKERPASANEMRVVLEHAAKVIIDRETAEQAEKRMRKNLPDDVDKDPAKQLVADDDVQFTVYTPQTIKPEKNYSVLAFAHLSKRRADAPEDEPDPIEELKSQVERLLGDKLHDYQDTKDSSSQPVPRGGELTFVPFVKGLNFNPPSRSFIWRKSIHREEFDVRASDKFDGQTLNGRLTVFLGSVVIAEVGLTLAVDSRATSNAERLSLDRGRSARRVKQVFASYSHKDEQVVAELAHVAPLFGSRFLMDRTHLEPGEDRIEGLQRLIREADVFQLFWSTNSMRSTETADEIKYATSLGRSGFILPTYWEEPLPRSPAEGLPPPEIDRLQFYRIYPGAILHATAASVMESRLVILGPQGAEIYVDDERHGSIGSSGRVILKSLPMGQHILRLTHVTQGDDERVIEIAQGSGEQIFQAQLKSRQTLEAAAPYQSAAVESPPRRETIGSAPITGSLEMPGLEAPTDELVAPPEMMSAPATLPDSNVARSSAEVVFCINCGATNTIEMRFCARCGISLSKTPPVLASAPQASVVGVQPPTQTFQAPAGKKRNRAIWIPLSGVAAMVLFAAIVGPILFIMMSTQPAANKPPTTASNPISTNSSSNLNSNSTANNNSSANALTDYDFIPNLEFARLNGSRVRLRDFRGRVVLLHCWATWSTPSTVEVSLMNELQKTLESRGLTVIGLTNDDTADQVRDFQKENPQDYLIGLGRKGVEGQLSPSTLPTTYLIDRRGLLRKKMIGTQSRAAFEDAIEPLLREDR